MRMHEPETHGQLCSLCGKTFQSKMQFKEHMMYVHTNERPFKCDQCPLSKFLLISNEANKSEVMEHTSPVIHSISFILLLKHSTKQSI